MAYDILQVLSEAGHEILKTLTSCGSRGSAKLSYTTSD